MYVSTAGRQAPVPLREALMAGLAPDGGLYVPLELPPLADEVVRGFSDVSFPEIASVIARHLLAGDVDPDVLERIALDAFDFPLPLRVIEEPVACLELFHGPTHAFKDVGARFMARLMQHFLGPEEELTILAATSGDTGSAVAHAFLGLKGITVVVLFPRGQVSEVQQRLFTTLGDNVHALSVEGVFDDCQRMVKGAFADEALRARRPLASANSINIGRLLPQIFYYFEATARRRLPGRPLLVSTPSGNFGNLTAGLMARRLGCPIDRFVAATNANDVVPEFLRTGTFRPRASVRTLSNAMDVGDPSNLQRMQFLYGGDVEALRADVSGHAFSDPETLAAIAEVHRRTGLFLDPHTAVGYLGLKALLDRRDGAAEGIVLGTAHPAKFGEVVQQATGEPVPLPPALASCLQRQEVVTPMPVDAGAFRRFLLELPG